MKKATVRKSVRSSGKAAERTGKPQQAGSAAADKPPASEPLLHPDDLQAAGKALRDSLPRDAQAVWKKPAKRADPLDLLRASDAGRLKELLPIRYGRMLQSPFTFYRGAAAVMAADLATLPSTGLRVQACGDCHLLNFGGFATPERQILFDINDFDETLPAPWEWDVKRLVASFVLAARSNGLSDDIGREAAMSCARSYRKRTRAYAEMSPLDVWYARIDADDILALAPSQRARDLHIKLMKNAKESSSTEVAFPRLTTVVGGEVRIRDTPPLIFHAEGQRGVRFHAEIEAALADYRRTLPDDRRVLLDRYRIVDSAIKVVGIGSVGTRCGIALLMSSNNEPLFLQWKEARPSVLAPYAGPSVYAHQGQRVVMGQRLMQPASDLFLGWLKSIDGHHGYVRQLRDAKVKPLVEAFDAEMLVAYGKACGWSLARAHAKVGDAARIGGYLGSSAVFDEAMGAFAIAYADQAERDHAALKAAVRAGRITVHVE